MFHAISRSWPLLAAVFFAPAPALAQQTTPCLYLVETIEQRALKIHAAQTRMSASLELDADAEDGRVARTCRTARDIIATADDLAKFAEARTERCETVRDKDLLRAAVSLGSAQMARSLVKALCAD